MSSCLVYFINLLQLQTLAAMFVLICNFEGQFWRSIKQQYLVLQSKPNINSRLVITFIAIFHKRLVKYWHARNCMLQLWQSITWLRFHGGVGQTSETHRWSYTPFITEHRDVLQYGYWQFNPLFPLAIAPEPGKLDSGTVINSEMWTIERL